MKLFIQISLFVLFIVVLPSCSKNDNDSGSITVSPKPAVVEPVVVSDPVLIDTVFIVVDNYMSINPRARRIKDDVLVQALYSIESIPSFITRGGFLKLSVTEDIPVKFKYSGLDDAILSKDRDSVTGVKTFKSPNGEIIENAIAIDIWSRDSKYFERTDDLGKKIQHKIIRVISKKINLQATMAESISWKLIVETTNEIGEGNGSNYKSAASGTILSQPAQITKFKNQ